MSKRAQQKYTSPIPKQRNGSAAASAITTLQRSAMTTESQIIAAAHHTAQSEKLPKDIDFDVTWLERISQRLQQEGDDQFVSWLQTFTLFCQKLAQRDEETQAAAQRIQQLELTLEEQSEKLEQDRVEHDIQARELAEKKAGIVSKERELNERELNGLQRAECSIAAKPDPEAAVTRPAASGGYSTAHHTKAGVNAGNIAGHCPVDPVTNPAKRRGGTAQLVTGPARRRHHQERGGSEARQPSSGTRRAVCRGGETGAERMFG